MFRSVLGNMPWLRLTMGALLAGVLLAGCGPKPDTHPGQPVTKRKNIFHEMLRSFEPMALVIRGREAYNKEKFLQHAQQLEALARQPWDYFGPDSYYTPTRASPAVWQYPDRFKAREQQLIDSVDQLARVSQSGNLDTIKPAYEKVYQACNTCHTEFRVSSF